MTLLSAAQHILRAFTRREERFARLTARKLVQYVNVIKWNVCTRSFGVWFEPRYIFRAGRLD